jgi:hypothetical protein
MTVVLGTTGLVRHFISLSCYRAGLTDPSFLPRRRNEQYRRAIVFA